MYVSLGVSATKKKIAEGLEQLLKNPKATVDDWMDLHYSKNNLFFI
ncbi:hypothetical protein H9X57_14140 [Flavobacterium piscinae]|nr:hypothetical protein [Flavobacterium piscinae]MBC8884066.1 hypothetical protein [Flavobacterium piscinae]